MIEKNSIIGGLDLPEKAEHSRDRVHHRLTVTSEHY